MDASSIPATPRKSNQTICAMRWTRGWLVSRSKRRRRRRLDVVSNGRRRKMRFSKTIIAFVRCMMLASLAAPAQKRKGRAAQPRTPAAVVSPIDTEALKNLLTQQRQHPLLVNFWATFCDPCRDEFPDLVKIHQDYRPEAL